MRTDLYLSLAKTTSGHLSWGAKLCKDHSPRRTEVIGSITSRRIYGRSTVDCGGNRERFASWRADQWFGWALTLLDGRIDGGGHRLREAARPGRQLALRRASPGARPCRARDAFGRGDSMRSTRSGCDA